MFEFMTISKALSDEGRVRIVMALQGRELCVCQIIELLSLAPSTVSKHMSILKQARLVLSRKEGRWIYYRLAQPKAGTVVAKALNWIVDSLKSSDEVKSDNKRLAKILKSAEACCMTGHKKRA